jgi:hypothetical protein
MSRPYIARDRGSGASGTVEVGSDTEILQHCNP